MKFLILLFVLQGCASYHPKAPGKEPQKPRATGPEKNREVSNKSRTIWELISGKQLTLQLKEVDKGETLSLTIEEGLSEKAMPGGHWELTGFEESGKSFVSMNTSKKFILNVKGSGIVYAGSIVIGCPRLQSSQFKLLKRMKFFNRYPFSSSLGLCELVIGNDISGVKAQGKIKKLTIGF